MRGNTARWCAQGRGSRDPVSRERTGILQSGDKPEGFNVVVSAECGDVKEQVPVSLRVC